MPIQATTISVSGTTDVYDVLAIPGHANNTLGHHVYLQNRTGVDLIVGDAADLNASPPGGYLFPDGADFDVALRSPDRLFVANPIPGPSNPGLTVMIVTE